MSSVDLKYSVTSSSPSMNTNDRTFENCPCRAYTNISVKRANAATLPEISAITMSSGFEGRGERNLGSAGTPPYANEWRTVLRKSSGPLRPLRRLRVRRAAILRVSGYSAFLRFAISSRLACMNSTSSGSGLRRVFAMASAPRSATSLRRISASISCLNFSMRLSISSLLRRSSRSVNGSVAVSR